MRYIRTKYEIYEVVKEDGEWLEIISNFERKMKSHCVIKKHAVIKQADTIEELCDEFVIEFEDKSHCLMEDKTKIKDAYQINKAYHSIIYGAIWTDKGLIYVAKMNEKGELELL